MYSKILNKFLNHFTAIRLSKKEEVRVSKTNTIFNRITILNNTIQNVQSRLSD